MCSSDLMLPAGASTFVYKPAPSTPIEAGAAICLMTDEAGLASVRSALGA